MPVCLTVDTLHVHSYNNDTSKNTQKVKKMENVKVHTGKSPEISDFDNNNFLQRFCKCRGKLGVKQWKNLYTVSFKSTSF